MRGRNERKAPKVGREAWRREDARKRLRLALEDPELALELEASGKPVIPWRYAEEEREELQVGTWLANPEGEGYGRQWQWPFNRNFAVRHKSYRVGVLRAMQNLLYAPNWRFAALKMMGEVIELLAQLNETYYDIEAAQD